MFDDVSSNIKGCAIIFFVLGVISAIFTGYVYMQGSFFTGIFAMVAMGFSSYLFSLLIYAVGEIIENLQYISEKLLNMSANFNEYINKK